MKVTKKLISNLSPAQVAAYKSQTIVRRKISMNYDSVAIMTDADVD